MKQTMSGPWTNRAGLSAAVLSCICVAVGHALVGTVAPVGEPRADLVWTVLLGVLAALAVPRVPGWMALAAPFLLLAFVGSPAGAIAAAISTGSAAFAISRSSFSTSITDAFANSSVLLGVVTATTASASLFSASLSLHDHGLMFTSAVVTGLVWTVLLATAIARLDQRPRRAILGFAGVMVVAGFVAGVWVAHDLREAYRSASAAESEVGAMVSSARSGDLDEAGTSLGQATFAFEQVESLLDAKSIRLLRYVPIAGPNVEAAVSALSPTGEVLKSANAALAASKDLQDVVSSQRIEVAQVERLARHGDEALAHARELQTNLTDERNVWILSPVGRRLDAMAERVEPISGVAEVSLVEGVRSLLGSAESRSYLLLFGNTAEARELGGFAGGTAVVKVDDGRVTLTRADRPLALNAASSADSGDFTETPPQRFLDHRPWLYSQNFTAMSDFPTLARTLDSLYPQISGDEIDGVAYIDPQALAALVGLVGEVKLEGADRTIRADEVRHFVTVGQYDIPFESREDREDFLGELIEAIFDVMLSGEADFDPANLQPVVDSVRQDRLMFVPFDENEYSTIDALGMVGGIERTPGRDYLAVSHLNGGPNKLDSYTHRTVSYQAEVDPLTGQLDAVVEVTLRNDAPAGLSSFAAGNNYDYPTGTNRVFVVVHTPHDAVEWMEDGDEPELTRSWREFGLQRHEQLVVIPRGQSRTVTLRLAGTVTPGDYQLDLGHQPLVHNDGVTIDVKPNTGTFVDTNSNADQSNGTLRAELDLSQDKQFHAAWTPPSVIHLDTEPPSPLARTVGGES